MNYHCPHCWTPVRRDVHLYLARIGECDERYCDPKKMEKTQ